MCPPHISPLHEDLLDAESWPSTTLRWREPRLSPSSGAGEVSGGLGSLSQQRVMGRNWGGGFCSQSSSEVAWPCGGGGSPVLEVYGGRAGWPLGGGAMKGIQNWVALGVGGWM